MPVIQSLGISFTSWDLLTPARFVGFDNYKKVLTDPLTLQILSNTLSFMTGFIIATVALSLLAALALSNKLKGFVIFRTLFYLPNITSTVAISLVWMWIFHPEMGFINVVLNIFHIPPFGW
jgi:multiple sugar transport system permease protein